MTDSAFQLRTRGQGVEGWAQGTDPLHVKRLRKGEPEPVEPPAVQAATPPRLDDLLVDEIVRPLEDKPNAELDKANAEPVEDDPTEEREDLEAGEIPARRSEASRMRQRPPSVSKGTPDSPPVENDPSSLITPEELQALIGDDVGLGDDPNVTAGGEEN